jgi:NTP pyrophosphatase (non-canonical NTP hydrolase)
VTLNELRDAAYQNAREHGWWEGTEVGVDGDASTVTVHRTFAEVIALIHSEASEALEEWRSGYEPNETYFPDAGSHGPKVQSSLEAEVWAGQYGWKPEGVPAEFADIIIRVLDACGAYGIDIEQAVRIKMLYNKGRPFKHGRAV